MNREGLLGRRRRQADVVRRLSATHPWMVAVISDQNTASVVCRWGGIHSITKRYSLSCHSQYVEMTVASSTVPVLLALNRERLGAPNSNSSFLAHAITGYTT